MGLGMSIDLNAFPEPISIPMNLSRMMIFLIIQVLKRYHGITRSLTPP